MSWSKILKELFEKHDPERKGISANKIYDLLIKDGHDQISTKNAVTRLTRSYGNTKGFTILDDVTYYKSPGGRKVKSPIIVLDESSQTEAIPKLPEKDITKVSNHDYREIVRDIMTYYGKDGLSNYEIGEILRQQGYDKYKTIALHIYPLEKLGFVERKKFLDMPIKYRSKFFIKEAKDRQELEDVAGNVGIGTTVEYKIIKSVEEPESPKVEAVTEKVINDLFCNMQKQLADKLAPLLKVKKQLNDAKQEIRDLIDEASLLRKEVERKDLMIYNIKLRMEHQYEEFIDKVAKKLNVNRHEVVDVMNQGE